MFVTLWMLAARAEEPAPAPAPTETAAPAASEADLERAMQLYKNGAALYDEGLYDQAIEAFQASYDLSHNPKLLFNIANAQERNGDLQASYDTLNRYRVYADETEKDTLERRLRSLERRIDEQQAASPVPAPAPAPAPMPAPAPAPVPTTITRPNTAKWVLLGTGAVVAGAFGTTAGITYVNGKTFVEDGDDEAYAGARMLNNLSVPLAGVGAGLAVLSFALPAKQTITVTAGPTAAGGGAVVAGSF
ncbi:MAG: hypothetical protein H6738_04410 [Alphaproteobacteria bacterium]|nr:hypothetical protein [Alphaproteobacteria bacterium]MCB9696015.1 hypothetical protein [Alphaproteobacteria bacterium]